MRSFYCYLTQPCQCFLEHCLQIHFTDDHFHKQTNIPNRFQAY